MRAFRGRVLHYRYLKGSVAISRAPNTSTTIYKNAQYFLKQNDVHGERATTATFSSQILVFLCAIYHCGVIIRMQSGL